MRLRHPDGTLVHLAYCTNVHPAESVAGITEQLAVHAEAARIAAGADLIGVGLWLPAATARELAEDPPAVARLRAELGARGLETVTLNGFPYRGFHAQVVKRAVYYPDWSEPARLAYTLDLARVLAGLLPEDAAHGSVSTVPLSWRTVWTSARRAEAARQLEQLTHGLKRLEAETGRLIRVGLEPEPGCVAETTGQVVDALSGTDPRYLGVCLDACHLAVQHEDPHTAAGLLDAAGIPLVKLQASAALAVEDPANPEVRSLLSAYAEPRFLHQTREPRADGTLLGTDDLGTALAGALPAHAPWRVHYHVPLHEEPSPPLRSTRPVLRETLRALFGGDRALTDHVEVETYTWSVLPDRPTGSLAAGIAAELNWARAELTALGLREETA